MRDKRVHPAAGGARPRRGIRTGPEEPIDEVALVAKAGEFEAATGAPHSPFAVFAAIVLALVLRPVGRALRAFLRG